MADQPTMKALDTLANQQHHVTQHFEERDDLLATALRVASILTANSRLTEKLQTVLFETAQALSADQCVLLMIDDTGEFYIRASSQGLAPELAPLPAAYNAQAWQHVRAESTPLARSRSAALQLYPSQEKNLSTLFSMPLFIGADLIGILLLMYPTGVLPVPSALEQQALLLDIIANQVALAITAAVQDEQRPQISEFLDELARGTEDDPERTSQVLARARLLSFDPYRSHAVVMVEVVTGNDQMPEATSVEQQPVRERDARHIKENIQQAFADSDTLIALSRNLLTCIVDVSPLGTLSALKSWFLDLSRRHIQKEQQIHLFISISRVCRTLDDYPRAFGEAFEVMQIGRHLRPTGGVMTVQDLGVYYYLRPQLRLSKASQPTLDEQDQYQHAILRLIDYDREHSDQHLLSTLQAWMLSAKGHPQRTADLLRSESITDLHRNTIPQRIRDIIDICGIDVQDTHQWLPLWLAMLTLGIDELHV